MKSDERRIHARLQGSIEIRVTDARGEHKATLRDLSQSGAGIILPDHPSSSDATLTLLLPGPESEDFAVKAKIVRVKAVENGFACGVQFVDAEASKLEAVDYLLGVLFSGHATQGKRGDDRRVYPRISKRISVRCESPAELLAMVENISLGGVSLHVDANVQVGEELLIVLPGEDGEDLLSLTCCVANIRELPDTDPAEFLAGLEFTGLTPQRMAMLDAMLTSMLRFA